MWPAWWWPQALMQPLILSFSSPRSAARVGEARRDLLRDGDRAGVGEAAVIETGAGDDVADQIEVGLGEPGVGQRLPDRVEVGLADVRQHDVLRMRDAQFVEAVLLGEVGHQVDLVGAGIAGNAADRLQADVDDGIARLLVRLDVLVEPDREIGIARSVRFERRRETVFGDRLLDFARSERRRGRLKRRIGEHRGDAREFGGGGIDAEFLHFGEFRFDLAAVFVRAEFVDQDLDPRLVHIVAAAVAIVDAQARFEIAHQIVGGDEILDLRPDHRGAAHAAADEDLCAEFAITLHQLDADIVEAHRGAILVAGDHREFELAGQVAEFGVERAPLADQLGPGTRVGDLVRGGTRRTGRS